MKNIILDREGASKKIQRMAFEILEQNHDASALVLAGIRDNGAAIARLLRDLLKDRYQGSLEVVEISLDKRHPREIIIEPARQYGDAVVIVVDDVANSGMTMLYALQPLLSHYPKRIQTLALVERTHKRYPIHLDYVGISIATTLQEHIFVEVENGQVKQAWLE